jgi:AcrR family transcriptional regulator
MTLVSKTTARTDRIAQSAAKLFARQGYHGTSTREIAYLADVSENTLFRHFENKEALFWSAFRAHSAGITFRRDLLEGIAQCDSPEVVLPKIIELFTYTASDRPELIRLIAVAFIELHWKAEAFCQSQLSPVLSAINQYVQMNVQSGKFRNLNPTILTAALMSTALMHPGISRLIGGDKATYLSSQEASRAYARFWLDLLTPKMLANPWLIDQQGGEHPV